jgi:hypothetical protein
MKECDYIQGFPRFPGGEDKRPCLLEQGHSGNHVVIEPRENKRLEVPRDGSTQSRSGHVNVREYIRALFPSKGNS